MKTLAQVKKESGISPRLVQAVVDRVGKDSIDDINNYGANAGFNGFIYYSDTVKFWRSYKSEIMEALKEDASNFGETVIGFVKSFRCLEGEYSEDEIGAALYGNYDSDLYIIYNALAWYAAETVCRAFEE